MAAIICVVVTGALLWGAWRFLTNITYRRTITDEIARDARQNPIALAFVVTWMACILVFFWGIFIPPLGEILTPVAHLKLWQLAGIGAGVGFVMILGFGNKMGLWS